MRLRHYVMENKTDMGTSGTKVYDLDFSDPITELDIRLDASNGATNNKEAPLERTVSKIEIVDGGEVLWSAPGDVALAVSAQLAGHTGHCYNTEVGSDTPYASIPIRFGRHLFDPQFAFNPLAHKNPQLRVTFDEATVRAAGATGFVSDSITMMLVAHLMEQAPAPIGFLGLREIETFTTLDSGIRRVALPTDAVIRNIINRVFLTDIDVRNCITNYKLSANGGQYVAFDWSSDHVLNFHAENFAPVEYSNLLECDNGDRVETWIGLDKAGQITARNVGVIMGADAFWPGSALVRAVNHANASQSAVDGFMTVLGWAMHNTLIIPMGLQSDPDTWFDAKVFNNLELHLTQGDASGEDNVVLERVYQY